MSCCRSGNHVGSWGECFVTHHVGVFHLIRDRFAAKPDWEAETCLGLAWRGFTESTTPPTELPRKQPKVARFCWDPIEVDALGGQPSMIKQSRTFHTSELLAQKVSSENSAQCHRYLLGSHHGAQAG